MDEQRKVVSIRKYKVRRRIKSLKRILGSPTALIISSLLLICGLGLIAYPHDTKVNPSQGFKGAKADLTQFLPGSVGPKY